MNWPFHKMIDPDSFEVSNERIFDYLLPKSENNKLIPIFLDTLTLAVINNPFPAQAKADIKTIQWQKILNNFFANNYSWRRDKFIAIPVKRRKSISTMANGVYYNFSVRSIIFNSTLTQAKIDASYSNITKTEIFYLKQNIEWQEENSKFHSVIHFH